MTTEERAEIEERISRNLKTYHETGRDLTLLRDEIRGGKKWKSYLMRKFGITPKCSGEYIRAAKVADLLKPVGIPRSLEDAFETWREIGDRVMVSCFRSAEYGVDSRITSLLHNWIMQSEGDDLIEHTIMHLMNKFIPGFVFIDPDFDYENYQEPDDEDQDDEDDDQDEDQDEDE